MTYRAEESAGAPLQASLTRNKATAVGGDLPLRCRILFDQR